MKINININDAGFSMTNISTLVVLTITNIVMNISIILGMVVDATTNATFNLVSFISHSSEQEQSE